MATTTPDSKIQTGDEKHVETGDEKHISPNQSDVELESNAINTSALLRKLDLRLLPAVSLLYLLSFLDRSNG
jgi:hypothetical protein